MTNSYIKRPDPDAIPLCLTIVLQNIVLRVRIVNTLVDSTNSTSNNKYTRYFIPKFTPTREMRTRILQKYYQLQSNFRFIFFLVLFVFPAVHRHMYFRRIAVEMLGFLIETN